MIVVKSISKSYGVPGLRLGIVASADNDLITYVKKDVSIWNLNSFAEFFMQIYSKYEGEYLKSAAKFQKERAWLKEQLDDIPYLKVYGTAAN